ncbi:transcription factor GTE2-like [Bidens hawaiensis]|uniref:transcription factor GTE2-like n=1 Tax=Bidens hawaiensis TaxID=980011 RepID=UPI00404B9F03
MASAILSAGNAPRSTDYYYYYYYMTNNLDFTRFQNIQNPNPNFSHQRRLPYSSPPQPAFIRYVTFRLSSYTRTELRSLKTRLISDLERVRFLRQRLFSTPNMTLFTGKAVGRKRTNPVPAAREAKKHCARMTQAQKRKMKMRECSQILGKLMQHKHGWVFNAPVDAVGLKLFDYHSIINKPMDLGTIKSKLAKNEYNSPVSFASDVRLTFENAMVYNGKGSNVYIMAERLLLLFENMWDLSSQKGVRNQKPVGMGRVLKKPEMTAAEKAELAARLMSLKLGREGMNQIIEIVKKGVLGLELEEHQGDELELDIALLDNDTLWGLHGFITRNSNEVVVNLGFPGGNEAVVDQDVDIGDEMGSTVFTPIEIEKDGSSTETSSESDSSSSSSGGNE